MLLAQRVQVAASAVLDAVCMKSRNLYNEANWYVRQEFFNLGTRLWYDDLYAMLRHHKAYVELQDLAGAHPPQQVLRQVEAAWNSFFAAMRAWRKEPERFRGRPWPPGYKRRGAGNVVAFTKQQSRVRGGRVRLPEKLMARGMLAVPTTIADNELHGVRIVPCDDKYTIEIVHVVEERDLCLDKNESIGVDIGLANIVTTSDGCIVKGGAVKSINQFFNKQLAGCKALAKVINNKDTTRKIKRLSRMRNNKVHDKIHQASRRLMDHCIASGIGKIYVGYNAGWKDGINMGTRNDQAFVQIPHLKLVKQIEYKAALVGIKVIRVTEAFTSQACSRCGVCRKSNRVHRGLYICSRCGLIINADINAARNIKQKGLRETSLVVEAATPVTDRGDMSSPPGITVVL